MPMDGQRIWIDRTSLSDTKEKCRRIGDVPVRRRFCFYFVNRNRLEFCQNRRKKKRLKLRLNQSVGVALSLINDIDLLGFGI